MNLYQLTLRFFFLNLLNVITGSPISSETDGIDAKSEIPETKSLQHGALIDGSSIDANTSEAPTSPIEFHDLIPATFKFEKSAESVQRSKSKFPALNEDDSPIKIESFYIGGMAYISHKKYLFHRQTVKDITLVSPSLLITFRPSWKRKKFHLYISPFPENDKYRSVEEVPFWDEVKIESSDCINVQCDTLLTPLPQVNEKHTAFYLKFLYKEGGQETEIISFRANYDPLSLRISSSTKILFTDPQISFEKLIRREFNLPKEENVFSKPTHILRNIQVNNTDFNFEDQILNVVYPESSNDREYTLNITYKFKAINTQFDKCSLRVLQIPNTAFSTFTYFTSSPPFDSTLQDRWLFVVPKKHFVTMDTILLWIHCHLFTSEFDSQKDSVNIFAAFEKTKEEKKKNFLLPQVSLPFRLSTLLTEPEQFASSGVESLSCDEVLQSFMINDVNIDLEILSKAFSPHYRWELTEDRNFKFSLTVNPEFENFIFSAVTILHPKNWAAPAISPIYECQRLDCLNYVFSFSSFPVTSQRISRQLQDQKLEFRFSLANNHYQATWSIFITTALAVQQ